jgi:hypothetical protein
VGLKDKSPQLVGVITNSNIILESKGMGQNTLKTLITSKTDFCVTQEDKQTVLTLEKILNEIDVIEKFDAVNTCR